jgi:MFS transporter, FSR family, fosmidomycin resistance protein
MTQAIDLPLPSTRASEGKLVWTVCLAHFVSHYYIMLLAPLLVFVHDEYAVSYTELGLALTAFNVVTTLLQTPAGFLVDRMSARLLLIAGLLVSAAAIATAGLVHSYWVFVAMFAIAGLGNTVFHPADYSLLSHHVPRERAGRAFSLHTFAGMLGNAAAPPGLLFVQSFAGWRGAFLSAAALGLVAAAVVALHGEPSALAAGTGAGRLHRHKESGQANTDHATVGWRLLLSPPIMLNLLFFILLSVSGGGLNNFLVASLAALWGTPAALANTALTGLLFWSAIGVLAGGALSGRTGRHGLLAATTLTVTGIISVLVGVIDFNAATLVIALSVAGFFSGIAMPSRDVIVRSVTPPGAYGRVFGFVSTGFNIGGIVSPIIFGQLLDQGSPRAIFFCVGACTFASIATVAINTSRRPGE